MGVGRKGKSEGESEPETQCAIERQSFGITTQITLYYLPPLNNAYIYAEYKMKPVLVARHGSLL